MAAIIKIFKEKVPALRFIGKKYDNFGHWGEWFANGWFEQIEKAMGGMDSILKIWENGGGYVGLERRCENDPFEYWIGIFTPADTPVPKGFDSVDFPAVSLGTCWIYGKENDVHDISECMKAVTDKGFELWKDAGNGVWSFENCLCPRFTTPDEHGNIIMDYCYYVK